VIILQSLGGELMQTSLAIVTAEAVALSYENRVID